MLWLAEWTTEIKLEESECSSECIGLGGLETRNGHHDENAESNPAKDSHTINH